MVPASTPKPPAEGAAGDAAKSSEEGVVALVPSSKKEASVRRRELLAYLREPLRELCVTHAADLMRSKFAGSLVLQEVIRVRFMFCCFSACVRVGALPLFSSKSVTVVSDVFWDAEDVTSAVARLDITIRGDGNATKCVADITVDFLILFKMILEMLAHCSYTNTLWLLFCFEERAVSSLSPHRLHIIPKPDSDLLCRTVSSDYLFFSMTKTSGDWNSPGGTGCRGGGVRQAAGRPAAHFRGITPRVSLVNPYHRCKGSTMILYCSRARAIVQTRCSHEYG